MPLGIIIITTSSWDIGSTSDKDNNHAIELKKPFLLKIIKYNLFVICSSLRIGSRSGCHLYIFDSRR